MGAIAAAVVGAVVSSVLTNLMAKAIKVWEKRGELSVDLQCNIESIKIDLEMITASEEDWLAGKGGAPISAVVSVSMEKMRDLAQDIEDCLDRILRYNTEYKDEVLRHGLRTARCAVSPPPFADEVKQLMVRLKDALQRKVDYNINESHPPTGAGATPDFSSQENAALTKIKPVGIDEPKAEILNVLNNVVEDQLEELKVISIVGFCGSGKSTLARAVYDSPGHFTSRAWIHASNYKGDSKELLMALRQELCPDAQGNGDAEQLQTEISNYLNAQRCLIVLEDIEEHQWDGIKSSFPEKTASRIIVTTTIRPLAILCCNHSNNGYVYDMKTLDEKHSKELLEAILKGKLPGLEQSSTLIVSKCDGHPLALVSVANFLLRKSQFTETDCKKFWRDIGSHMEKEYAFRKLKQILMSNYLSLPGRPVNLKICLLYVSVFPNGHPIKRSSLVRRWFAEGYVKCGDPYADQKIIEELIDRNIIRVTADPSRNAKVKTCRAHGIMQEFLRQMSLTANFTASLCHPKRGNYRHLFVDGRPSASSGDGEETLRAHSLTVCRNATEALGCLAKCELLRVLDLGECCDLKDEHIGGISKLWHLRYLSLGGTISKLPKEIEKLHCLETLDVRKANRAIEMPVKVIKLPYLTHLLGKFKVVNWKKSKENKYIQKRSNLQTLAGFVMDDDIGFAKLMGRMIKLQKVKFWCNSNCKELLTAIVNFVREMGTCDDCSLSLYLGNETSQFISSLGNALKGYLSSLKICGPLHGPDILTQLTSSLSGLKELCLASTSDLTIKELCLSNLDRLRYLECLKLVKVSLKGSVIKKDHFPGLLRLCLVQCATLPTVENGALPNLVSLQLLAEDLGDISGIKIEQIKRLEEVALDSKVNMETKKNLERAAKRHLKRPRVLYLDRVDPHETGSMRYVAAMRPAHETGSTVLPDERQIQVQSNFAMEHSSASEQETIPGPSLVSGEPSSSRDNEVPSSSKMVSQPIQETAFRTLNGSTLS